MKDANLMWQAEKNYYASVASGIVGRQIFVDDADGQELGYTGTGNVIYIARSHPLFRALSEKEKKCMRLGIAVHESLHQVFTDFTYYEEHIKRLDRQKLFRNRFEMQIYHDLVNLVEDPAIESMALQVIGGPALKALDFTIAKIDEFSGDFDVGCVYPFEEVINALVQFGDVGIIHGTFRFQTSRKVFKEISPLFYKAINEPDAKQRINMVYPIFQTLRKLWTGYSDSKMEELSRRFSQGQGKHGSSPMNGSGTGSTGKINPDSAKNKKREATIRKVSKEEYEKLSAQASSSPDTDGDIELLYCDDVSTPKQAAQDASKAREAPSPNNTGQSPSENPEEAETGSSGKHAGATEDPNGGFTAPGTVEDGTTLQTEPVPELTSEDYKKILDAISQKGHEIEAKKEEMKKYYDDIQSFPEINKSNGLRNVTVINTYADTVNPADEWRYDNLVGNMSDGISMMVEELRDIFYNDRAMRVFTDSGRISLKRVASGRITTRLFERKTSPGHKADMCIGIAGDLSGSMNGTKLIQEQLAMIALAEIFAEFGIPLYFMGFNVPFGTPVQTHYIRWENSRFERERLLHLKATGNNFDSYSIRYMTRLMQERSEKHKLMFILSDGTPSFYYRTEDGIKQNTLAIQEAKSRKIDVVGIGIGKNIRTSAFLEMYGKDFFLQVNQPRDLFSNLAKVIISIVMGWD